MRNVFTLKRKKCYKAGGEQEWSKPHKIKIGLLGLGTVGSGVYKLIEKQKEEFCKKAGADVEIVKILVHNMEKKREGVDPSLLTDNWRDIIDNDEIQSY